MNTISNAKPAASPAGNFTYHCSRCDRRIPNGCERMIQTAKRGAYAFVCRVGGCAVEAVADEHGGTMTRGGYRFATPIRAAAFARAIRNHGKRPIVDRRWVRIAGCAA